MNNTKIEALKEALKADTRQAAALRHLLSEYRRDKGSKTSYRKSVKALATLGFTEEGSKEFLLELHMKTFYPDFQKIKPEFFHFGDDGKLHMVIAPPGGGMATVEIDFRLVSFIAAKAIRNKTGRAGEGGGMVKARRTVRRGEAPKGD